MIQRQLHEPRDQDSSLAEDFVQIKGIGLTTQTRLHNAGILTLAQLSTASPEEIAAVTGLSAKHIAREDWISQARRLAEKAVPDETQMDETTSQISERRAIFRVELLLDQDNSVQSTHVIHEQDNAEDRWNGWIEPRLVNFFVRCAGLHRPLPAPTTSAEPVSLLAPVSTETVLTTVRAPRARAGGALPEVKTAKVLNGALKINELAAVQLNSDVPQYVAHPNEPFYVRFLLDLSGVKTSSRGALDCHVTVWARKLGSGGSQIVGERQSRVIPPGEIPCLVETRIPSPGMYRLDVVATLTPPSGAPSPDSALRAWFESGLLQVN